MDICDKRFSGYYPKSQTRGTVVCPIDIDGDGDYDLTFSVAFGLQLYLNPLIPDAIEEGDGEPPVRSIAIWCNPNPFNSSAEIWYRLASPGYLRLSIYNLVGQKVATLFSGMQQAGAHKVIWDAESVTSGVYFARLESSTGSRSVKMVLLR